MKEKNNKISFNSAVDQLEIEKQRDEEKMSRNLEKQKQLYQYGDFYRRGL